jgi:hypothetical protein
MVPSIWVVCLDLRGLGGLQLNIEMAGHRVEKAAVAPVDPVIRAYGGDTAINTGSYVFTYKMDGQMVQLPARYSFTLVKTDGKWLIADHHSSAMPK